MHKNMHYKKIIIDYAASPSARKVWIEIWYTARANGFTRVTFREEGVDWNILPMIGTSFLIHVTFREEGVDWNSQKKKKDTSSEKSPSARKVWIEIDAFTSPIGTNLMSPSARKVWIEMFWIWDFLIAVLVTFREEGVDWNRRSISASRRRSASPSARKVWIEIILQMSFLYAPFVTFREEGVDWNPLAYTRLRRMDMSPSARKVWIEIFRNAYQLYWQ